MTLFLPDLSNGVLVRPTKWEALPIGATRGPEFISKIGNFYIFFDPDARTRDSTREERFDVGHSDPNLYNHDLVVEVSFEAEAEVGKHWSEPTWRSIAVIDYIQKEGCAVVRGVDMNDLLLVENDEHALKIMMELT